MKLGTLVLVFLAAALAVADAQHAAFLNTFPYCICSRSLSAYSLSPVVKSLGGGKYCFMLNVSPPAGCTSYCCAKADVRKIEFNIRKECNVAGAAVRTSINGVPAKVSGSFDSAAQGPPGSTILRVTQLGLGPDSNGAEVCIHLLTNNAGRGCTTLEDLCVPPPGAPPGTCTAALFDTQLNCCPLSTLLPVSQPSLPPSPATPRLPSRPVPRPLPATSPSPSRPPPPSPSPPPPPSPSPTPPPSPAPPPLSPLPSPPPPLPPPPPSPSPPPPPSSLPPSPGCPVCIYLTISPVESPSEILYPASISGSQCHAFADQVIADIKAQAAALNAAFLSTPPLVTCTSTAIKVCGAFISDADGAELQDWINLQVGAWLGLFTGGAGCASYFKGYRVEVTVGGGDGPAGDRSCLAAATSVACQPRDVAFPACQCNTRQRSTPFAARPVITRAPGRTNTTTLYCFTTDVITPYAVNSTCGGSTTLAKVEIWANETQRRKVVALATQAAIVPGLSWRSVSWGARGDFTLKATPLNWNASQAAGGRVCIELDNSTDLKSFCNAGVDTCWINLFSPTRKCCPLYSASLVQ